MDLDLIEKKEEVKDFIKNPYIIEFLDIKDKKFLEKELESNLLEHEFMLELGRGFSFVFRQKKIDIDGENFDNPTIRIILYSDKNDTIVKYSVLNDNKNLFASKYQVYLPTEKELINEIERQKRN